MNPRRALAPPLRQIPPSTACSALRSAIAADSTSTAAKRRAVGGSIHDDITTEPPDTDNWTARPRTSTSTCIRPGSSTSTVTRSPSQRQSRRAPGARRLKMTMTVPRSATKFEDLTRSDPPTPTVPESRTPAGQARHQHLRVPSTPSRRPRATTAPCRSQPSAGGDQIDHAVRSQ